MRTAKKPAALMLALLVSTGGTLGKAALADTARVYKWVDDHGVTHFSAVPPSAGHPAETINIHTGEAAQEDSDSATVAVPGPAAPVASTDQPASVTSRFQHDQARCDQAREAEAALASNNRVQVRESDSGEYRTLNADELEEWRARAREEVRHFCP